MELPLSQTWTDMGVKTQVWEKKNKAVKTYYSSNIKTSVSTRYTGWQGT